MFDSSDIANADTTILESSKFPGVETSQQALEELKDSVLSPVGKIFTMVHKLEGRNAFASKYGTASGELNPTILPCSAKLLGILFSNRRNSVEVDVDIHKNGLNVGDVVRKYEIRNTRVSYDFRAPQVDYAAGDLFDIYIADVGTNNNRCTVTSFWQILSAPTGNGSIASL